MLVGPDATRVDAERPLHVADRDVFDDDLVEDAFPGAVLGPDTQPFVRDLPAPTALGQIAPRGPGRSFHRIELITWRWSRHRRPPLSIGGSSGSNRAQALVGQFAAPTTWA
jgi:hypothetical protein